MFFRLYLEKTHSDRENMPTPTSPPPSPTQESNPGHSYSEVRVLHHLQSIKSKFCRKNCSSAQSFFYSAHDNTRRLSSAALLSPRTFSFVRSQTFPGTSHPCEAVSDSHLQFCIVPILCSIRKVYNYRTLGAVLISITFMF